MRRIEQKEAIRCQRNGRIVMQRMEKACRVGKSIRLGIGQTGIPADRKVVFAGKTYHSEDRNIR
jgi:hypothetical protein